MTEPITADEAERILSPHLSKIRDSIQSGWKRWRALLEHDPELAVIVSNRSRANLVYDFIRHEALHAFDAKPDVTVSDSRGFLLLTFSEKIVMRFKKYRDAKLGTSSIPTQQSREYAQQALPGMTELTHLVAGYLPDNAGIDLKKVAIVCRVDKNRLWDIELDLGLDSATAVAGSIPAAQGERETVVRPKTPDALPGQAASEER